MKKFIDVSGKAKKEKKQTVFKQAMTNAGWDKSNLNPEDYEKVLYLGRCALDGDMFAATDSDSCIDIFKGVKGDEFD